MRPGVLRSCILCFSQHSLGNQTCLKLSPLKSSEHCPKIVSSKIDSILGLTLSRKVGVDKPK
ncbi:hypothetical protein ACF0H5_017560 [Mactra antiquata]